MIQFYPKYKQFKALVDAKDYENAVRSGLDYLRFVADEYIVSIRRMPYCVPRKCFVPLHHDFKFFKLWYKARNN